MAEGVENKGHDRKQKTSSTKASGEGVHGSERRRMYPLFFKLQVLKSFREDPDCKGNQRATARKYGIHRRQVQKWLVAEQSLRKSMGAAPPDALPARDDHVVTNTEEEAALPSPDVEMHAPETIAASPLTRDESASSDGIVGSSSSSSYSDEGPEPLDEGQPSLGFLVSVLNAFHDAPEWHGREAATAQKFGIKRWQLRRWLKKEAEIRAEAAMCSRYCGEGFRTPEYPRCDFSPDCTLPDQSGCDLSPRCNAAHLDRVVPHATLLLPEQQVCNGERCPLVGADGGYSTPSPLAHYNVEADKYSNSPSPPTAAPDGCLDFSMGKRQCDRDSSDGQASAKFYRQERGGACLPSVEMQVRVLDLRKITTEGSRGCPGGRCGDSPASPPLPGQHRAWPLAPLEADSCAGAIPRWPAPLPPPAHTPWPVAAAGGEPHRSAFAAVPPPAHCALLYW